MRVSEVIHFYYDDISCTTGGSRHTGLAALPHHNNQNTWKSCRHYGEMTSLYFHGSSEKYRNYYAFKELIDACYAVDGGPYFKKTFHGAQLVIDYLGKYTHLIVRMDDANAELKIRIFTFFELQDLRFYCHVYLIELTEYL